MVKQILLPVPVMRELRTTFKVGQTILSRALKYKRNSKRDQMLRAAALERGGLIYTGERAPKGFCPNVSTRYDHVNGWMYQNFANRVELRISLHTSKAIVLVDGVEVLSLDNMTIGMWGDVLYSLQQIWNKLNA
nr:MAG TPA: hypothetical protein [Caudoviricetes sp.]